MRKGQFRLRIDHGGLTHGFSQVWIHALAAAGAALGASVLRNGTHLDRIFEKTVLRRDAELVRLLLLAERA